MRYGTLPCSARTGTGCWRGTWPRRSSTRCWPSPGARSAFRRAFHGGRDAGGSLGQPEEFPEERRGAGPPAEDRGNPTVNFHGEKGSNETQQSTTDPEARLARKGNGKEAKLSYAGHVLMENRHGDLPAFFGPPITGEQRQSAWLSRCRVLLGQREPASPASAHRHPSQHGAAL